MRNRAATKETQSQEYEISLSGRLAQDFSPTAMCGVTQTFTSEIIIQHDTTPSMSIAENVENVRQRISRAAEKSGRSETDVTLVAVTKYVDAATTQAVLETGCLDVGESRPQQLWDKAETLDDSAIRWHMIGHLQRNKVRRTLPYLSLLHSIDSERLLKTVDQAVEEGRTIDALLEVNVSGEDAKHGFSPNEIAEIIDRYAEFSRVRIRGLMCMAGLSGGSQRAQSDFAKLRQLRDSLRSNCPDGVSLDELSMGMSGDFEEAITEGATLVRVGSVLFS